VPFFIDSPGSVSSLRVPEPVPRDARLLDPITCRSKYSVVGFFFELKLSPLPFQIT